MGAGAINRSGVDADKAGNLRDAVSDGPSFDDQQPVLRDGIEDSPVVIRPVRQVARHRIYVVKILKYALPFLKS